MLSYGPQDKLPNNLTYIFINNVWLFPHSDMTSLGDITDREGDIGNYVIRGGDSPYYPPIHGGYPSLSVMSPNSVMSEWGHTQGMLITS